MNKKSVPNLALVVPSLEFGGGVSTVANFIYESVMESGCFNVDLISLATSASDAQSVRLLRPISWRKGTRVRAGIWKDRPFRHVGARWTEFEFARYQPRVELTKLLNQYDVVQIVAGSPSWANVARDVQKPVALQVATLARVERERRHSIEGGPAGWWRRLMTRITSRIDLAGLDIVDVVFVENKWMHDFVSGRIGEQKVVYAPPGIDADIFHPRDEEVNSDPYILSVGRFADPRKNVPLMFRAYRQLRDQVPDAPILLMAGMSEPTADDWALAQLLGIQQFIQFRHGVSVEELAKLYRECTMFVLSSDEEGFGMVVIEAMASGVPVITTKSGGPQTIITHGVDGILVDIGDIYGLAQAMERLYEAPEVGREMGAAARRAVEERYSLHAAGTRFVERYLALVEAKARS